VHLGRDEVEEVGDGVEVVPLPSRHHAVGERRAGKCRELATVQPDGCGLVDPELSRGRHQPCLLAHGQEAVEKGAVQQRQVVRRGRSATLIRQRVDQPREVRHGPLGGVAAAYAAAPPAHDFGPMREIRPRSASAPHRV